MLKNHVNFDAWFRGQPAKQLSEAGYSGMELRDAKWQVLNIFRKEGPSAAKREVERLVLLLEAAKEKESIKRSQDLIQDFYLRRRY